MLTKIQNAIQAKLNNYYFKYQLKLKQLQLKSNDVFLVSYPRSGSTWLRFILANLLVDSSKIKINFNNLHHYCPEWEVDSIRNIPSPRIMKSHSPYNPTFHKVIYLVRDARDVYVSYYHYLKDLKEQLPADLMFIDFIKTYNFSYGSWSSHVESWINNSSFNMKQFKIIRYEDLLENPSLMIDQISHFIEIYFTKQEIETSIRKSHFTQMQQIEYESGIGLNKNKGFIRKGMQNQYIEYFDNEIWEVFKTKEDVKLLKQLEYIN